MGVIAKKKKSILPNKIFVKKINLKTQINEVSLLMLLLFGNKTDCKSTIVVAWGERKWWFFLGGMKELKESDGEERERTDQGQVNEIGF